MSMISEAKQRLKCETPPFFKRLKKYAIGLGVSAGSVIAADATMHLGLAPIVITICKYAIALSVAAGGTAELTAINPPKK